MALAAGAGGAGSGLTVAAGATAAGASAWGLASAGAAAGAAAAGAGLAAAGAAGFGAAGFAGAAFAPAAAAGFGGATVAAGCVVQKCRPHFGHTQNCCGCHGMPGAGSRRSMALPQRWQVNVWGLAGGSAGAGGAGVASASSATVWMIRPLTSQREPDDNCSRMIAAIILSGGASRRMGQPKAMLTLEGETFVGRIARVVREAGAAPVVVVTGVHHDSIAPALDDGVQVVRNADPDADQLSSLRTGLRLLAADERIDGALVALVDHPLIDVEVVRALCATAQSSGAPVVRPVCDGRHGHPVVFSRETFDLILHGDLPDGAKGVLRAFAARQVLAPTSDRGVLIDVDTPEIYEMLLQERRERGADGR